VKAIASVSVVLNVVLLVVLFYARSARQYMEGIRDDELEHSVKPGFRRFHARRYKDVTGVSGPGIPAEGVQFSDGWVVTHWLDQAPMYEPKTEVWHNPGVQPFEKVSGHGGATKVVWLDEV
jgi:hypothetical protein